jgi:tRNA nucleotidyltransferase (CCA-adding enzyme)
MAIAPETLEASRAFATTLRAVSVERVREEFSKTLTSQQPSRGLLLLLDLGFLPFIMPELIPSVDFEQNKFHRLDVFRHTLEVVENTAPDLVLRLSALLHDVGKPATLSVDEEGNRHFFLHEVVGAELAHHALTRLRYSNEVTESVTKLVRLHMRPFEAGPGGLRRILRDTGEEYDRWRALKEADIRGCKVSDEAVQEMLVRFDAVMAEIQKGPQLSPLSSLAVRGGDIMQLGTTEGPMIGEILRALHERVLDDPSLNTAEQLLTLAKSWIESGTFSSSSHARKNSRAS